MRQKFLLDLFKRSVDIARHTSSTTRRRYFLTAAQRQAGLLDGGADSHIFNQISGCLGLLQQTQPPKRLSDRAGYILRNNTLLASVDCLTEQLAGLNTP